MIEAEQENEFSRKLKQYNLPSRAPVCMQSKLKGIEVAKKRNLPIPKKIEGHPPLKRKPSVDLIDMNMNKIRPPITNFFKAMFEIDQDTYGDSIPPYFEKKIKELEEQ